MNRKPNEKWTLRLGLSQVIILLGVTTGCLALSFYLGFFSGKRIGFSEAMDTNIALIPKVPIESDISVDPQQVDSAEKVVADVYANLKNAPSKHSEANDTNDNAMPQIGVIEKIDQKNQKDLADVFGDDIVPPAKDGATPSVGNKDPWSNAPVNNQSEPMVIGDDVKNAAIDKALDSVATPKATTIAVATAVSLPVATSAATPTAIPAKTPTKIPTATPTKQKPAATPEVGASITRASTPQSGWYAQVAAPTAKAEADGLAATLRANGFRVVIESAQVRGESYYRILVGPEENRSQAEALVRQLSRESYLKGAPFIRMVK